jgi:Ca2+-binding RTX toxin-like protein
MSANLIVGNDGSNTLQGTAGKDVIYGFNPDGPQSQVNSIAATRVASGLSQPLFATAAPGDPGRLFIVEKTGLIKILDLATQQVQSTPFLNVASAISASGEQGLLGLAFDPNFATNGFFYVNLINTAGDTEIRRYQVSATNPNQADPASATIVITVDQPAGRTNHKAGWLGFGPDGYLYAALGDGGGSGDPDGNGQDIDTLLGKILRLDIASDGFPNDPTRNYRIPSDNPFVGVAGADEIWALGLRNPWRSSFDRGMENFYIADVGQGRWEEVNLGEKGGNYGWNVFEGPDGFVPGTPTGGTAIPPIHSYSHAVGRSITGGYVYRGESEGLQGHYFFADFVDSKLFTLHFENNAWVATDRTAQIMADFGSINSPSSFAEDGRGNLYIIDFGGEIFRLTPVVVSADEADDLSGNGGDDMLFGGSGNDTLRGGIGDDVLQGGNGSDTLMGDAGNDLMIGGPGNDIYFVDGAADLVVEDGGEGSDTVWSSLGHYVLAGNVETLRLTTPGATGIGNVLDNAIYGTTGNETLLGGGGNDVIVGGGGNDLSYGGAGNEYLYGGTGNDTGYGGTGIDVFVLGDGNDTGIGEDDQDYLYGGAGNDQLYGGAGVDVLLGESGDDYLNGGVDGDYLYGGVGGDQLFGGAGHDQLLGEDGNDTIAGEDGQDYFYGGNGNDVMYGGAGSDVLIGDAGDDTFEGGSGIDYYVGGAGNDNFVIVSGNGVWVINDFVAGGADDTISLFSTTQRDFASVIAAATDMGSYTVFNFDGGTILWVLNVRPFQFTPGDFAYA